MDSQHRQAIETKGYRELIADHCELVDRVAQLEERTSLIEYMISEEVMGSLVQPDELREVVAELGHGWRIERAPSGAYVKCPQCGRRMMRADADVIPNCPRCKSPCVPLAVVA